MDEADIAQDHIEKTLAQQIAQVRAKAQRPHMGECLNCGERLTNSRRYCDEFCRDDAERREKAGQRG